MEILWLRFYVFFQRTPTVTSLAFKGGAQAGAYSFNMTNGFVYVNDGNGKVTDILLKNGASYTRYRESAWAASSASVSAISETSITVRTSAGYGAIWGYGFVFE